MTNANGLKHLSDLDLIYSYLVNAGKLGDLEPANALRCALKCAHDAGVMIRNNVEGRALGSEVNLNTKSSVADLVTETDVAVEKCIRARISQTFPSHMFVGEETANGEISQSARSAGFVWIIDPIDGTTNFVHAFPIVTVSIALAYKDESVMGVVYNPLTDEAWFAWKGCGAYMKRACGSIVSIRTSTCTSVGSALISTGFGVAFLRRQTKAVSEQAKILEIVSQNVKVLMTGARDIRRIGSAACDMCYVAMGRTDSYFEFGVREWDIAAGLVILHEAGGESSTIRGATPYSIRGRNVLVADTNALRVELNSVLREDNIIELIEIVESN